MICKYESVCVLVTGSKSSYGGEIVSMLNHHVPLGALFELSNSVLLYVLVLDSPQLHMLCVCAGRSYSQAVTADSHEPGVEQEVSPPPHYLYSIVGVQRG